jgi:hypothetical protein
MVDVGPVGVVTFPVLGETARFLYVVVDLDGLAADERAGLPVEEVVVWEFGLSAASKRAGYPDGFEC